MASSVWLHGVKCFKPLRHRADALLQRGISSHARQVAEFKGVNFQTSYGETITDLSITWESWGDPTLGPDRTVVLFPSFSHGPHAASNSADPSPGWWDAMLGPGKAINTNHWRVVCPAALGSPFGATSPISADPATGKQYGSTFPQITPADQARVHALLLQHVLRLPTVHAVVGASMGGMQALHFASLFPAVPKRLVCIAATPRTSPMSVAVRHAQRTAITLDPAFQDGRYWDVDGGGNGVGPIAGLRVARQMGMMAYRSREEFDARFEWGVTGRPALPHAAFEVERYLTYQGKKFAGRFDANCYLLLSRCMDLMDIAQTLPRSVAGADAPQPPSTPTPTTTAKQALAVGDTSLGSARSTAGGDAALQRNYSLAGRPPRCSYQEAAHRIRADSLLVGVQQDTLCPAGELAQLAKVAAEGGCAAGGVSGGGIRFHPMSSEYGHDSFLHEYGALGALVKEHLTRGLAAALAAEAAHTTGLSAP